MTKEEIIEEALDYLAIGILFYMAYLQTKK